ncbi:MAG: phage holin family protein [Acidobacteriota bacterium]
MANRPTWMEAHRALGNAVLSLVKAEAALVFSEWKSWLIEVGKLLAMVAVVVLVSIYLPFVVLLAAIDGLAAATAWPLWLSALGVLGIIFLIFAIIGAIAYWLVKTRIAPENPAAAVTRRLDDHKGWWRHQTGDAQQSLEGGV